MLAGISVLGFRAADVKITRGDLDAAPLLSFACAVLRQVRVDLMVLCVLPWLVCCGHCVRCQCRRHLSVHGSVLRRVLRRALPADGVLPCTEVCKFAAASNGCTVFNRSTVVRSSRRGVGAGSSRSLWSRRQKRTSSRHEGSSRACLQTSTFLPPSRLFRCAAHASVRA